MRENPSLEVLSGNAMRTVGIRTMRGLGVVDLTSTFTPEKAMTVGSAALAGAAVGGSVLGYVASSDLRGAGTGALLAAGMTGLFDGYWLGKGGQPTLGVLFGALGVAGLSGAIWLAATRRRRR